MDNAGNILVPVLSIFLILGACDRGSADRIMADPSREPRPIVVGVSAAPTCTISPITTGPSWSSGKVSAVGFYGIRLGDSVDRLARSRKSALQLHGSLETISRFDVPNESADARGLMPWLRTFVVLPRKQLPRRDLSLVWKFAAPTSPSTPISALTVFRSPDRSGRMVVSLLDAPFGGVNADVVRVEFRKRFGIPSFDFSTSGSCGEMRYMIYGSDRKLATSWGPAHFRRCLAAYGPGNMPPFRCDPELAPRSAWFGLITSESGGWVALEDDALAYATRYVPGFKPSSFPTEQ